MIYSFSIHKFPNPYDAFVQRYSLLLGRLTAFLSYVILNEWLLFIVRIQYPPKWCTYIAVWLLHGWCNVKLLQFRRDLLTPYNHGLCHVTSWSHIRRVYECLAVNCHLHFWQNDRDILWATAITLEWKGYQSKSQHRKLTFEKTILPPLLPGLKPLTFLKYSCRLSRTHAHTQSNTNIINWVMPLYSQC